MQEIRCILALHFPRVRLFTVPLKGELNLYWSMKWELSYPLRTCWKTTSLPRAVTAATCNFYRHRDSPLHDQSNHLHNAMESTEHTTSQYTPSITCYLLSGLAGFCHKVEKTVFFLGKNRTGKNTFVSKNRFLPAKIGLCQNCHQSKLEPWGFLCFFSNAQRFVMWKSWLFISQK